MMILARARSSLDASLDLAPIDQCGAVEAHDAILIGAD